VSYLRSLIGGNGAATAQSAATSATASAAAEDTAINIAQDVIVEVQAGPRNERTKMPAAEPVRVPPAPSEAARHPPFAPRAHATPQAVQVPAALPIEQVIREVARWVGEPSVDVPVRSGDTGASNERLVSKRRPAPELANRRQIEAEAQSTSPATRSFATKTKSSPAAIAPRSDETPRRDLPSARQYPSARISTQAISEPPADHERAREEQGMEPSMRDRGVDVRIGSITFTVKAPSPPVPAPVAAPTARPSSLPSTPRHEGFRFSASRHYLRWS
jgi:hypothetical protein